MQKKEAKVTSETNVVNGTSKKKMTKRQKTVLLVSLCAAAVVIVTVAVLLAVFLPGEQSDVYTLGVTYKKYYSYAVATGEAEFPIDASFCGNIPHENFTVSANGASDALTLGNDFIVRNSGAYDGEEASFEVLYKDSVIADIKVVAKELSGTVSDKEGLFSMSANGVYVLSSDIDLAGETRRIASFSGEFYGNGHKIIGLDIGKGGLFGELRGATVEGIELIDVCGGAVAESACSIGVIADRAEVSVVGRSLTRGAITVRSALTADARLYVGGVIGYATSGARSVASGVTCKGLVSEVAITVSGGGDIKVGGIAGGSKNVSVRESRSYSEITVSVSAEEVGGFSALYVGGIVGADAAEYRATAGVYDIDETARLYSYAKIDVDIVGGNDFNYCYIGGLYGKITDRSVANSSFDGSIDIDVTRVNVSAGGVAGATENDTGYRMAIRGFVNRGTLDIYSFGTVSAGGLIGVGVKTDYEKCEVKNAPTVATDQSKLQGIQTKNNAIGVSK